MTDAATVREVLEAARQRSDALRARLVATGELLPAAQFAAAFGITQQALERALQARRLFAIEHAGDRVYPTFYADPAFDRRRLGRVVKALGDLSGWEMWLFFTMPKSSLGQRTPIDAMRAGEYELVRRAAAAQAER